jgi:ABC-2 type transport system ATP-binding protein
MTSQPTSASRAGAPIVACQGLTKVFKDFWLRQRARAVDNVSFHIDRKEIFGLLGPNGSGKSTTIKLMLGLLKPTSGRISIFGKAPTDVSIKKRIGYLPEESYLYGFLNARETLDYYGKLFGIDHRTRKTRTDELLEMVGLTHAQYRPVREYSKGMQRRIGIAQALINDPDLLILDEPTTGLDPIGTRQVKDLILELGRRGKSVLLSSHLLADVEDVVDRMVILYGGKIRREGPRDGLLTRSETTSIEADSLDDATLAEIDRIIRERTHGEKAVRKVAKPRQRLEDLFLNIVEEAKRERAATSGAMHGGETASFLRGEPEGPAGEELIESLTREEAEEIEPAEVAEETGVPEGRSRTQEMLESLLSEEDRPAEPETAEEQPEVGPDETPEADREPPRRDASEVDLGVIDSLTEDDRRGREG